MRRHTVDADDAAITFGEATADALRRSVATRPRRWLVATTLLLGLLAAVATTAAPPEDLTFSTLSDMVQSLMSVTVPFLGVLLAHDLSRSPRTPRPGPTLLAAVLLAAAVGLFGILVSAAALALAPSDTAPDPWQHAATIAVGGVLVQIVAQLVGTGLGLLLRPTVVACLATIVLPLGLWALLGAVDALSPAQAFTPYATVRNLLSGEMNAAKWAQWLAVLLVWGVGLNALGVARLKRRRPGDGATPETTTRDAAPAA
ncbi:hypothetical protein ACFOOK_13870 [Micromonospora krabiensis]|uniref:ABC-2 family transporter protein n=1 Tax=Micromonospora krabiensis TaxID=307121 RepID=A0A1C3N1N4_9ACTN|nr:hypothetical protein [Micromonospora krabiensis]SBV26476.1 hypothetical protein GA0070620_1966 [Micromonospora krabiensis]